MVEVSGRWYGVRGRRFVRPELILHESDGERRLLAELDEKPWAAQDGELWRATFAGDPGFEGARAVELSVAPDIVVALRGRPPKRTPAAARRRPRIPLDVPRPEAVGGAGTAETTVPSTPQARTPSDAAESARLTSRLEAVESSLQRERSRREEAEQALERQRTETRELSAELARARADVALSEAAEREAQATSDLLDTSRREQHSAQARYDALAAEHERVLRTQDSLREELQSRTAELDTTRAALDSARSELQSARAGRVERAERAAPEPREREAERGRELRADPAFDFSGPPAAVAHGDRPLNPSLRSHSWSLRLLAVIVLAAVVIAVIVILTSTVLH